METNAVDFKSVGRWYGWAAQLATLGAYRRAMYLVGKQMPQQGSLLVPGGGTGWFACRLARMRPNAQVVYFDPTPTMAARAQRLKNRHRLPNLHIHHSSTPPMALAPYAAAAVLFVFDVFTQHQAHIFAKQLAKALSRQSVVWVADYGTPTQRWQKVFVKLMYGFFKPWLPNLQTNQVPNIALAMQQVGFVPVESLTKKTVGRGLIEVQAYHYKGCCFKN